MKIFKVSIDNNPGAWKQGQDPSVLVPAETENEALEMVKNGWSEGWGGLDKETNTFSHKYGYGLGKNYIRKDTRLSVVEIIFEGIEITTIREEKLKRINKDENKN